MNKKELLEEIFNEMDNIAIEALKQFEFYIMREKLQVLESAEKAVEHLKNTGELRFIANHNTCSSDNPVREENIENRRVIYQNHIENLPKLCRKFSIESGTSSNIPVARFERISEEILNSVDFSLTAIENTKCDSEAAVASALNSDFCVKSTDKKEQALDTDPDKDGLDNTFEETKISKFTERVTNQLRLSSMASCSNVESTILKLTSKNLDCGINYELNNNTTVASSKPERYEKQVTKVISASESQFYHESNNLLIPNETETTSSKQEIKDKSAPQLNNESSNLLVDNGTIKPTSSKHKNDVELISKKIASDSKSNHIFGNLLELESNEKETIKEVRFQYGLGHKFGNVTDEIKSTCKTKTTTEIAPGLNLNSKFSNLKMSDKHQSRTPNEENYKKQVTKAITSKVNQTVSNLPVACQSIPTGSKNKNVEKRTIGDTVKQIRSSPIVTRSKARVGEKMTLASKTASAELKKPSRLPKSKSTRKVPAAKEMKTGPSAKQEAMGSAFNKAENKQSKKTKKALNRFPESKPQQKELTKKSAEDQKPKKQALEKEFAKNIKGFVPIYSMQEAPLLPTSDSNAYFEWLQEAHCTTYVGFKFKNCFFDIRPKTPNLQEIFPSIDSVVAKRTSNALWGESEADSSKKGK